MAEDRSARTRAEEDRTLPAVDGEGGGRRGPPRVAVVSLDFSSEHDPEEAQHQIGDVLRAFVEEGAEVELFSTDPAARSLPAALNEVTVHPITMRRTVDAAGRERAAMAANVALGLQLRARAPFDVVFERFSPWSHAGIEYAVEAKVPGILEVGASHLACKLPSQNHRTLAEAIGMSAFGGATAVVVSSDELSRCVRMRWGCAPTVEPDQRRPAPDRVRRWVGHGHFVVGFAGNLEPGLGLLDLVDAFGILYERHPYARLLVVGHGSEQPLLEAELERRGIEHALMITGWVAPDLRPSLMDLMDVVVTPFPTAGSVALAPFAVYEAMIAGRPVAGSSVPPLRHPLEHGRTGLTFAPRSVMGMVAALEVLHGDAELRREMGRRARKRVLEDSTPEAIARDVLAIVGAGTAGSRLLPPLVEAGEG